MFRDWGEGAGGGGCSSRLPLPWREEVLASSEHKVSIAVSRVLYLSKSLRRKVVKK